MAKWGIRVVNKHIKFGLLLLEFPGCFLNALEARKIEWQEMYVRLPRLLLYPLHSSLSLLFRPASNVYLGIVGQNDLEERSRS